MTTIRELVEFGGSAAKGDTKSFEGLVCAVVKADEVKDGEYGTMQRVQVKDGTGSRWFTAMDAPELGSGEQIIASGRVKGGPKGAYYNITFWQPNTDASAASAPASQPAAASAPARQPRPVRTVRDAERLVRWLAEQSEGWAIKGDTERQALVTTILIAWADGRIESGSPKPAPVQQPAPAPPPAVEREPPVDESYPDADDDEIPF